MRTVIEVLGILGAAMVLLAYMLTTHRAVTTKGLPTFSVFFLNLAGSMLLAMNNAVHHAWPGFVLSLAWALIASATGCREPK